jgi:predicted transcriptional regulator
MARGSWFDGKMEYQIIQDRVTKLASFTSALEDGVVSKQELDGQEQRLMAAMKQVEGQLNDDQHEKVTALLVEMSAYNVMRLLHELQSERARLAFGKA